MPAPVAVIPRLELVGVGVAQPIERGAAGDQRIEDRPDLRAVDVRDDLREELRRQVPLQRSGIAGRAEADDLVAEPHHLRVGLDVALLAHEVKQVVAAALELIQPRGGLAQRPLGPDLVVVHGKQPHELLDVEVHRGDLRGQQRRNIALEQIRVADKHPAQAQMGHERDQQRTRQHRIHLDDAQVRADAAHVARIHPDLPLVGEAREVRIAEIDRQDLLDDRLGQGPVPGRHGVPPDLLDHAVSGLRVVEPLPPQQRAHVPHDLDPLVEGARGDQLGRELAHLAQRDLVHRFEHRPAEDLQQPAQRVAGRVGTRGVAAGDVRGVQERPCQFAGIRELEQVGRVGSQRSGRRHRSQAGPPFGQARVADAGDGCRQRPADVARPPRRRVLTLGEGTIDLHEARDEQRQRILARRAGVLPGHQDPRQTPDVRRHRHLQVRHRPGDLAEPAHRLGELRHHPGKRLRPAVAGDLGQVVQPPPGSVRTQRRRRLGERLRIELAEHRHAVGAPRMGLVVCEVAHRARM